VQRLIVATGGVPLLEVMTPNQKKTAEVGCVSVPLMEIQATDSDDKPSPLVVSVEVTREEMSCTNDTNNPVSLFSNATSVVMP
jgi:hypothetical protein